MGDAKKSVGTGAEASRLSGGHIYVFAGAGCSKALSDMPLQADLIDDFLSWDVRSEDERFLSQSLRHQWDYFFENNSTKYTPIIVPFLFQKDAWLRDDNKRWKGIFDEVWKETEALMSNAGSLLFWGYGLPSADYHMFSFLYQILDGCNAECEVVDKISEETRDTNLMKVGKLLGKNIHIFRDGLVSYLAGCD